MEIYWSMGGLSHGEMQRPPGHLRARYMRRTGCEGTERPLQRTRRTRIVGRTESRQPAGVATSGSASEVDSMVQYQFLAQMPGGRRARRFLGCRDTPSGRTFCSTNSPSDHGHTRFSASESSMHSLAQGQPGLPRIESRSGQPLGLGLARRERTFVNASPRRRPVVVRNPSCTSR